MSKITWEEWLSSTILLEVMTIDSKGQYCNDVRTRLMSHSRTGSFITRGQEQNAQKRSLQTNS